MKKLVAFIGSPRKNANTYNIVQEIAKGAQEAGAEVKIYNLKDMKLDACLGCFYCRKKETCVLKDDMTEVYEDMKDASAVVIGAPIYFGQVNGLVKNLMDRMFPLIDMPPAPRFGTKKAALVYTFGAPDASAFQTYLDYNTEVTKMYGFDVIDVMTFSTGNDPRAIGNHPETLAKALELGKKLVG